MSILNYDKTQIVALVEDKIANRKSVQHWDICKALCEGKTIEQVADDFNTCTSNVEKIKKNKCKEC